MNILQPAEQCVNSTNLTQQDEVFDHVRNGRLEAVLKAVEDGYDPTVALDRNGASPLLWAAGSGHMDIVTYLIEQCGCSAEQGQRGKRSFSGRTPLHWAARNGHLPVVAFLVNDCQVDLDATTADGTTAFCWACWQGHQEVMEFLHEAGCDVTKSNSFGCNAVLWCAQGSGSIETLKWLQSIRCEVTLVNSNGHGALHKAAQRGRGDICRWLILSVFAELMPSVDTSLKMRLIGPDSDGCCPSDLARMAGHPILAAYIAKQETSLARTWYSNPTEVQTVKETRRPHRLAAEVLTSSCQRN